MTPQQHPPLYSGRSTCDGTRTWRSRMPMLCTAAAEVRDRHKSASGTSLARKISHTPCPQQPSLAFVSLRVRGVLTPTPQLARHYIGTAAFGHRYQPEKAQPFLTRKQPCAQGRRSSTLPMRRYRSLCDGTRTWGSSTDVALARAQAFARWLRGNILPIRNMCKSTCGMTRT
jgi:hypothetical protein